MDSEIQKPEKITRRDFVQQGAKKIAGVAALIVLGGSIPRDSPEANQSPLEKVRQFESMVGDKPLTFQQAKKYIPLLTAFYRENYPTIQDTRDINPRIYLLKTTGEEKPTRIDFNSFFKTYPRSKLTSEEIQSFMSSISLFESLSAQTTERRNVLLLLDRINDPNRDLRPEWKTDFFQFEGEGNQATRDLLRPAVGFRSIVLHELVHADVESNQDQGIDPELLSSFERISRELGHNPPSIDQVGFNFVTTEVISKEPYSARIDRNDLEELIADYFMSKIATENLLPYSENHGHTPIDIENFKNVLRQSNISDEKLYKLHQKRQAKEFMLAIASGAKNIDLTTREQMLDFAMKAFVVRPKEELWTYLQQYFDGIRIE